MIGRKTLAKTFGKTAAGLPLLGVACLLANVAFAELRPADVEFESALELAFEQPARQLVKPLDGSDMAETQGELWPMIFAVAATDIALQAYFWGVYVPQYAAPSPPVGLCPACEIPGGKLR